MITSADEAIDEMFTMLRDAWLLDVATAPIDIVYGNVAHDYHGQFPAAGDPIPWLNAQVLQALGTSKRALSSLHCTQPRVRAMQSPPALFLWLRGHFKENAHPMG